MTIFHWIIALVWFIINEVDVINDYTPDEKEYKRCHYPLSKNIR